MACCAFFYWVRVLVMLELTWHFGPLISIIANMFRDMAIFFCLFIIQLLAFGCVAILIFVQVDEYTDLFTSIITLFRTAVGDWDLSMYSAMKERETLGIIFHVVMISVNMLLILNLLIAIMSDTYANLS